MIGNKSGSIHCNHFRFSKRFHRISENIGSKAMNEKNLEYNIYKNIDLFTP